MNRTVLELTPSGMWVRLGTSDERIVKEVIDRKAYERPRLGFVPGDRPGEVWADLGASIGAFSHKYAGSVDRIYAYEPDPDTFQVLEVNMDTHPNVIPINKAVADYDGTATFTRRETMNSRNTMYRAGRWTRGKVEEIEVPVISGAHLPPDVNCVKADVEGAEKPLMDVLPFERIDKFVMEWSFDVWPVMADYDAALARLDAVYPNVKARRVWSGPDLTWNPKWNPPCINVFAWR